MAQVPHGDKGLICPLNGKDCSTVCHKCPLWVQVRGKNPQSKEEFDAWKCSFAWLPFLLIENSQQQRQTCATVDALREETMQASARTIAAMLTGDPANGALLIERRNPNG